MVFIPLLLFIVFIEGYNFKTSTEIGDSHIGAFDGIKIHEEVVKYLESKNHFDTKIGAGGFLEVIHHTDINTRYLSSNGVFTDVKWDINSETKILIFDNIEIDSRYDNYKSNRLYKRVFRIEKGNA